MSINFSTLQGLTIPEGVVTQFADAAGNVLWSAVKKATITLSGTSSASYADYNGTRYTVASTFEAAIGDTISLYCGDAPSTCAVYLNGTQVTYNLASVTYSYTVVGDATIEVQRSGSGMSMQIKMYITEISNDLATVTINCEGFNGSYGGSVVVNAPFPSDLMSSMMSVTNNPCTIMTSSTGTWSYDVPAGTTIVCDGTDVYINGTAASSKTYTVTGDVTLRLYTSGGGRNVVEITET